MTRTYHWFDFETTIVFGNNLRVNVRVEATLASGGHGGNGCDIEGIKVRLLDSNVELLLSDGQMQRIRTEIFERCQS